MTRLHLKEIDRAQRVVAEVERARVAAEEKGIRDRDRLRRLVSERAAEIAREEGRNEGWKQGLERGRWNALADREMRRRRRVEYDDDDDDDEGSSISSGRTTPVSRYMPYLLFSTTIFLTCAKDQVLETGVVQEEKRGGLGVRATLLLMPKPFLPPVRPLHPNDLLRIPFQSLYLPVRPRIFPSSNIILPAEPRRQEAKADRPCEPRRLLVLLAWLPVVLADQFRLMDTSRLSAQTRLSRCPRPSN